MEIHQYIQIARRWWSLVLIGALVAGAGSYFFSSSQQPVYRASATLLVSEGDVAASNDMSGLQTSARLAQSYVERLKNYQVLQEAIDNLNLPLTTEDLEENLQVRLVGNTQLIILSVEHSDPRVARDLANEIPVVFAERNSRQQLERFAESKTSLQEELERLQEEMETAEETLAQAEEEGAPAGEIEALRDNALRLRDTHSQLLQSYEDIRVAEARGLNNVIVDEPARRPQQPVRPRVLTNTVLATVAGLMAAGGVALFMEYMDSTIKGPEEVEALVGAPTLGVIAEMDATDPAETLVVQASPRSPTAEAYRQLRTNLMYSLVSRNLKSVLVTSPNPGEGKSTTAANLALAMVQAGKRVILVDSDLRRPALHRHFNLSNRSGLTNLVLTTEMTPEEARGFLLATTVEGLRVLTSGSLPPNPAELLGSERMRATAAWLERQADYVIYDSPPALAVTDAAVLSRLAGTTLMVVRMGETSAQALEATWANLRAVESDLAGVVLNRVTRRNGAYTYYHYYQSEEGYGYAGNGQKGPEQVERMSRR